MDQDPDQIFDQDTPSEVPQNGPSLGEKAKGFGQNLKQGADTAKDLLGQAKGGSGDGIGSAMQGGAGGGFGDALNKGLGALGGKAGGAGGLGKSLDGIKGASDGNHSNKAPSMFKGLEGDAKPGEKNDLSADSNANPSAKDAAKKVAAKGSQAVNDAVETAKDAKDVARLVATGATDATAWADLAKRALQDPKAFAKRYGRVGLYIAGFFLLQTLVVVAIVGAIFFGIYKVYLTAREVWEDPTKIVTELRVSGEMAQFLAGAVSQLTYERNLAEAKRTGAVIAEGQDISEFDLSGVPMNPETEKMHEAWNSAGLAARFIDEYKAEIKPNGNAKRRVESFDPTAWSLYVNGQNMGDLSSARAKAFISIFTADVTKWEEIYTRSALKGVAQKNFNATSFKLDLPDSERNMEKSRENVTKQIVSSTLKPIEESSGQYYDCLISGANSCAQLGLGTADAPSNTPVPESKGWLANLVQTLLNKRNEIRAQKLSNKVNKGNLGSYTSSVSEKLSADVVGYEDKDALAALVRTGSSDTILSSIGKSSDNTPDTEALLEMYDLFQTATTNGNYARVNYDREAKQSTANALNYFVGGGQLLNNDIGLLDSWAMTENLSVLEESPVFRASVIGNPIGIFAQGESEGYKTCQKVYADEKPVGEPAENLDRGIKSTSCFTRALVPNAGEFQNEKQLTQIYSILEQKNKEYDNSGGTTIGGLAGLISEALSQLAGRYNNKEIRTSPVAAEKVKAPTELGPDFDAYTNQVYGVSRTGAEINGEAFDTMKISAEALWAQAKIDDEFGIGASYQSNEEVAKTLRLARSIDREKMAFRPLSDRLFSLKTPDSLAGKLALLTPTNRGDSAKKTLALLRPTNLSSAIASRMMPATFADDIQDVNPQGAVRTGYPSGDPSNTMNGGELWAKFNCANGGPTQQKTQPEGIPFTVPVTTNPCKRESVIAKVSTCIFDTEDSCSFGAQSATPTTSTPSSSGIVGDIGQRSDGVPCAEGSNEIGDVESRYTASLKKDSPLIIKLCQVPVIGGRGNNTSGQNIEGGIVVNSRVSGAWVALGNAAKQADIELTGSSFRLADSCGGTGSGTACAKPGTSMHQLGIAVDFSNMGSKGGRTDSCAGRKGAAGDKRWEWLFNNAEKFGIKQYSYEPWHWDLGNFPNRCDSKSPAVF